MSERIREPVISVLGHVDHGKTTFLDWIRGTVVSSREAGGITQHIGATDVPFDAIKKICGPLLSALKIETPIRGLLFIDTPGHEAFTNLRKRGGSVADLAVLMLDINDGLKPQTIEALNILRQNKVPFVVAANKVDNISGWDLKQPLAKQQQHVQNIFYERFYNVVAQLGQEGFDSEIYTNIKDFRKHVAIVPISARSGYGVPEVLMMLIGLSQQFLKETLKLAENAPAKGTILEVKEERGLGTTIDVIIYDGIIRKGDQIVVGAKNPILTKVKALLRPKPLDEMRDPKDKFKNVPEVSAAAGVKIAAPNLEDALSGSPVYVGGEELIEQVKGELENVEIKTDQKGLILRADTIGSLEALINTLQGKDIPIKKASIGKVPNQDIIEASAVASEDRKLGVVLAFNSGVLKDARALADDKDVTIFEGNVIYKLLEDYEDWVKEEKERERAALEEKVTSPAKIQLLPKHVFRQSKPAIVGVEILAGKLSSGCRLMREDGKVSGRVKQIQKDRETVKFAEKGDKVALSIDGVTIGRQINEGDTLFSYISTDEVKELLEADISDDEKSVLLEIRKMRRSQFSWG